MVSPNIHLNLSSPPLLSLLVVILWPFPCQSRTCMGLQGCTIIHCVIRRISRGREHRGIDTTDSPRLTSSRAMHLLSIIQGFERVQKRSEVFVQIKYLTLRAVLSNSAALLLITKVLCLQGRKGWFALQERFHVPLLVGESFRLDALSSSKNT